MNIEDFEHELGRQPLRPVPAEWRATILSKATGSSLAIVERHRGFSWLELLWPSPKAWASLAAVWILILILNLASTGPATSNIAPGYSVPAKGQFLIALEQQHKLRAELMGSTSASVKEEVETPGPRSQSRPVNHKA